jgi:hypothetical protein
MKRTLLFFILLLTFMWPSSGRLIGQQSLTFDDLGLGDGTASSGTYNSNDTFGFDVLLTFKGGNRDVLGLFFWLETNTAFAGSLSVTGVTYGTTFPDPNDTSPNPAFFNWGSGASPGYLAEDRDLGSLGNDFFNFPEPGTYDLA